MPSIAWRSRRFGGFDLRVLLFGPLHFIYIVLMGWQSVDVLCLVFPFFIREHEMVWKYERVCGKLSRGNLKKVSYLLLIIHNLCCVRQLVRMSNCVRRIHQHSSRHERMFLKCRGVPDHCHPKPGSTRPRLLVLDLHLPLDLFPRSTLGSFVAVDLFMLSGRRPR